MLERFSERVATRRLQLEALAAANPNILVLQVRVSTGAASFALTPEYLGIDRTTKAWNGVAPPSVPLLEPDRLNAIQAHLERSFRDFTKGEYPLLRQLPNSDRQYALLARDRTKVNAEIARLEDDLKKEFDRQFRNDVSSTERHFMDRLFTIVHDLKPMLDTEHCQNIRRDAGLSFREHMERNPVWIRANFLAPLMSEDDGPWTSVLAGMTERPFNLFEPEDEVMALAETDDWRGKRGV